MKLLSIVSLVSLLTGSVEADKVTSRLVVHVSARRSGRWGEAPCSWGREVSLEGILRGNEMALRLFFAF